jgi:hypothetical protein
MVTLGLALPLALDELAQPGNWQDTPPADGEALQLAARHQLEDL